MRINYSDLTFIMLTMRIISNIGLRQPCMIFNDIVMNLWRDWRRQRRCISQRIHRELSFLTTNVSAQRGMIRGNTSNLIETIVEAIISSTNQPRMGDGIRHAFRE